MNGMRKSRAGFGLTELVVASAAAAMMFALMAPALDKGQAGVDVRRCQDNLRRLARAHFMYVGANGGFAPMALAADNAQYEQLHPNNINLPGGESPGNWWDGHGWYSLIGPYIGEPAWAAQINYAASMSSIVNEPVRRGGLRLKIHACPADIGLQRNEWSSGTWARVLANYVVNAGNTNYGQTAMDNVQFLGSPFARGAITPLTAITDGVSYTLLMCENVVLRGCTGWGGAFSENQTALGGQMFTGFHPPNPNAPDGIGRGRNGNGDCGTVTVMDARYTAAGVVPVPLSLNSTPLVTYLSARSKHPGGVNVVMCNGATGFITNDIDPAFWRALSTAQGAEGL
jgi:hypothetical protein